MRARWILMGLIAAALTLSLASAIPAQAQAKRAIRVVATSYKLSPA